MCTCEYADDYVVPRDRKICHSETLSAVVVNLMQLFGNIYKQNAIQNMSTFGKFLN